MPILAFPEVLIGYFPKNSSVKPALPVPPPNTAKEHSKGGVPTASSTHENSHEPDTGNTPPASPPLTCR